MTRLAVRWRGGRAVTPGQAWDRAGVYGDFGQGGCARWKLSLQLLPVPLLGVLSCDWPVIIAGAYAEGTEIGLHLFKDLSRDAVIESPNAIVTNIPFIGSLSC